MHRSVLLQEAVDGLKIQKGDVVVDGTLGSGGHTKEICARFGPHVKIISFDLDSDAIERAKSVLGDHGCDITFVTENFKNINKVTEELGVSCIDRILFDLGWSSDQFETSGRGFSFMREEPLSMTLTKTKGQGDFDARDVLNTWTEEDIANVLYAYGEERFARRIAREIVEKREEHPIETTTDLVKIIIESVPSFYRRHRLHPATKTFQALRIVVNDELENLRLALGRGFAKLSVGGRIAVITFHSLEDRIVKNFFRNLEKEGLGEVITKKPIVPEEGELRENPRARSAKLRIIEKIKI